ncbi:hypothetical protein ABH935_006752 [Catenulispora sp. GAS73]
MPLISHSRRTIRAAGLTTVFALVATMGAVAAAVPGHAAVATATAQPPAHQRTVTVDGVPLTIDSSLLPTDALQVSKPGDLVQQASAMEFQPYRDFSVAAVPFGTSPVGTKLPSAGAGDVAQYRDLLNQSGSPTSTATGPTASLFGQTVVGTLTHRTDAPDGKSRIDIVTARWVVAAGNRLWIVEAARDSAGATAGFGRGISVASSALATPTTVKVTADAASSKTPTPTKPAPPSRAVTNKALSPNSVPLGGTLPMPSWWSGLCDNGNGAAWNLGTSPHALSGGASFMGMEACGPTRSDRGGGSEPVTSGMPGTQAYEWECAELSARYMVTRYGISNPGEYGSTAANDFFTSYGQGHGFSLIFNGTSGQAPRTGDVISWDANPSVLTSGTSPTALSWGESNNGHTAVVTGSSVNSSGNGSISIIEENYNDSGTGTVYVKDWVVQSVMASPVGTVNWLHNPADGGTTVSAPTSVTINGLGNGTLTGPATISSTVTPLTNGTNDKLDSLSYSIDGTVVAAVGGTGNLTGGDNYTWTVDPIKGTGSSSGGGTWSIPANLLSSGTHTMTATAVNSAGSKTGSATFTVATGTDKPVGATLLHDGVTSVYSVDGNGHLWETWLTAYGQNWATQDMTYLYGTPVVKPGTAPAALFHDGVASVYTVDVNGHLHETWLPALGQNWATQDMTYLYGTPVTSRTPVALAHPNASGGTAASVYTVDGNGHLDETWLPAMGQNWGTQDMTYLYGSPVVKAGTGPAALLHDGVASVYSVDGNGHLWETWLTAYGQNWATQDMSYLYRTPVTSRTPVALAHPNASGGTAASVYTVDGNGHLDETWLPAMGQNWGTQDMTYLYGSPVVKAGTAPAVLLHDGVASVYSVDGNGHLWETWLTAYGQNWATQDMSYLYATPTTSRTPIAVAHPNASGGTAASVYTADSRGHLDETWLPVMGQNWATQDMTMYGTPIVN